MNAMAITENEYYTDKYMGYANDMVNHYEDESSYANDGYESDRSSYGNDNYDPEYPRYKPDYKQHSNSYEYDDKYKSKKDSVSISKINCINNNVNINGNNTGDINVGNSGRTGVSDDGTNEGVLAGNEFGNDGERYFDGYEKKDNGIGCVINNSNNNTIITAGNAIEPEPQTCEECFREFLTQEQIDAFLALLDSEDLSTLGQVCEALLEVGPNEETISENEFIELVIDAGGSAVNAQNLADCLERIGVIFGPDI
jgi:hypothetical protein